MSDEANTEAALEKSEETRPDVSAVAKPLHLQRLDNLLRLDPFLNYIEKYQTFISDDDATDSELDGSVRDVVNKESKLSNGLLTTRSERKADRVRVYNLSKVRKNRKWVKNVLLSESSSDSEDEEINSERLNDMLKCHLIKRRYQTHFYKDSEFQQYQYYSAGLLSNTDKFAEHQRSFSSKKKIKSKEKKSDKKNKILRKKKIKSESQENSMMMFEKNGSSQQYSANDLPTSPSNYFDDAGRSQSPIGSSLVIHSSKHCKKEKKPVTEAMLIQRRKRLWGSICKKEISRAQKQKVSAHKEMLSACKKMAQGCLKECRKEAILSQKIQKDIPGRCKRLSREMLLFWKKFDKVEKEHRKRAEKEAQEQLKMDIEHREAKRQQRKLNFLITQTELYAHFMGRKMTGENDAHKNDIVNQLNENESDLQYISFRDDYDCEVAKDELCKKAEQAYTQHVSKTLAFDGSSNPKLNASLRLTEPNLSPEEEKPQPKMFVGKLKSYQLKGMNWLYQLYNNGINGILADEMGLGKTVQSISFLAHVAETLGIWGPFLVIAPASTLHNWQQEFTRFVPKIKVLPYWGNASDRKIIRKFWGEKDLHTEQASFHVLITSYQLVIQDVKYFQRIKWQYMILDEAQAIKSAASVRWKLLLGFNCRNRLLLTGTPIQNSMAELWALLHFIMPTMFDSHQEFNEWFSKDIESHAENKSIIDEKHLSRLHMILKPFMLRRIKKDVENELSDKIEILQYCALTSRQKHLYKGLKNKISIEDLFNSSSASVSSTQAHLATSSLMNLVIQFRKVCNHPELFERREVRSPFHMTLPSYIMTKFLYRNGILEQNNASRRKVLNHTLGIFHPENIHKSIYGNSHSSTFSFLPFIDMTPSELTNIMVGDILYRWLAIYLGMKAAYRISHNHTWNHSNLSRFKLLIAPTSSMSASSISSSLVLKDTVFTSHTQTVYSHLNHALHRMPETKEHYQFRMKKLHQAGLPTSVHKTSSSVFLNEDLPQILECCPTEVPKFLLQVTPKIVTRPVDRMCSDANAAWQTKLHQSCGSLEALQSVVYGNPDLADEYSQIDLQFFPSKRGGLNKSMPKQGWTGIVVLDKEMLVTDSGKLKVLDSLLTELKAHGHRVLIYSQMTRMIDILEEYMWHRKHTYIRLDGSSKISDRRDMVADFQTRSDIFVFLLSTRAGGLGINLTAADTVIFYDSDWNPTVDQQAMDRAHRLGQTKQVTVYRLICKGTIEERILQRAREKSEIQRMVISGGNFKPDTLKPKEVVSLLLDDDEMESKLRLRQEEKRMEESGERKRKRKDGSESKSKKKKKPDLDDGNVASNDVEICVVDSIPVSPLSEQQKSPGSCVGNQEETSNDGSLVVDDGAISFPPGLVNSSPSSTSSVGVGSSSVPSKIKGQGSGSNGRRGRPKGSGKRNNASVLGTDGQISAGRGRVSGSSMSAAELAGAQAGRSAAYAAYGYPSSTPGSSPMHQPRASTPPSSSPSPSNSRGSLLGHRKPGVRRSSPSQKKLMQNVMKKNTPVGTKVKKTTNTTTMGFYTEND